MMSINDINLPKDLCFSDLDFVQENFNVDLFLQEHRKVTKLERMRDDLGIYLKLLRSAMIDLINRDYTDFVNLSSNLIGLDTSINDLQAPLGQLREEVMQVHQTLNNEIGAITNNLSTNKKIIEYKQSLHSLQQVYSSLLKLSRILSLDKFLDNPRKIDILEQAAAELNQLKFHLTRCKLDIAEVQEKESKQLEQSYVTYLNQFFLACIHERNIPLLIRCLRVYVTLEKISDAENLVRKEVICPVVSDVISVDNLQSDTLGLQTIYDRLLRIPSVELKELLDVTLHPNRLSIKGFNFLINSFWVEVEEKIEQCVNCIFAPGDPVLFHKRYVATVQFLDKLESESVTPDSLKENSQYKRFLKKWNLPVYFQIRYQEIAGSVEKALSEPISATSINGTFDSLKLDDFSLSTSSVVWNHLLRMWADDVYLDQLFQRFWKFTLQISARFQTWSYATLNQENWTVESNVGNLTRLDFLIYLYSDIEKLIKRLPSLLEIAHSKLKDQRNPLIMKLLQDSLDESLQTFVNFLPRATDEIVNELLSKCVPHLKQVTDIPRLFRRTKRDVPTKPCGYVKNSLAFLFTFHENYKRVIPKNANRWLELTVSLLTKHYLVSVTDVLTSVQKTEESLKRLKKIRDKSTGGSYSLQGVSDDEKIRIQLQVDVQAYTSMMTELEISSENVLHFEELLHAVETAIKKP